MPNTVAFISSWTVVEDRRNAKTSKLADIFKEVIKYDSNAKFSTSRIEHAWVFEIFDFELKFFVSDSAVVFVTRSQTSRCSLHQGVNLHDWENFQTHFLISFSKHFYFYSIFWKWFCCMQDTAKSDFTVDRTLRRTDFAVGRRPWRRTLQWEGDCGDKICGGKETAQTDFVVGNIPCIILRYIQWASKIMTANICVFIENK